MALTLYNTLTRRHDVFQPIDPNHVGIYVCGPTVYDFAHIGNGRSAVANDILVRLLKYLYPKVTFVRNITDIDDKILKSMEKTGQTLEAITQKYAQHYAEDMASLGCLPPDVTPFATRHIPKMLELIGLLIERGHAYEADGHVLFHVPSMAHYGRLSRLPRDELEAGARVEVAPYKRDAADFILWKPSSADQPGWDSPWGRGRPGWHIECSAMTETYLGLPFDIHAGGLDLIFPHHENEIAQSCCAHGTDVMANYWVHNGFLQADGATMSKTLGNFYTVHELLADHPAEALRYALLSSHYRQPLDFTQDGLRAAKAALDRIYTALEAAADLETDPTIAMPADFLAALEDDLNAPLALAKLHERVKILNSTADAPTRRRAKSELLKAGSLINLAQQNPQDWLTWRPADAVQIDPQEIESLIRQRAEAKAARDFTTADKIRDGLAARGIILQDSADGTTWRTA